MKKFIAITGPESTAKSTLTKELSTYFQADYYLEFSREYLENKGCKYSYEDVDYIAKIQVEQYEMGKTKQSNLILFDTWLIITKVWFEWTFKKVPEWLEQAIKECPIDLYLLCRPDIPWEPDPLRENGGKERDHLYLIYKNELISRGCSFVEIEGIGDERVQNAINAVKSNL